MTTDEKPANEPFLSPDGRVTEHAVEEFTRHYCWYLAWVLHDLTGWPMLAVSDGLRDEDGATNWVHVVVEHPGGDMLDVTGLTGSEDLLEEWGPGLEYDIEGADSGLDVVLKEEFVTVLQSDPHGVDPDLAARTRELAQALLVQCAQESAA